MGWEGSTYRVLAHGWGELGWGDTYHLCGDSRCLGSCLVSEEEECCKLGIPSRPTSEHYEGMGRREDGQGFPWRWGGVASVLLGALDPAPSHLPLGAVPCVPEPCVPPALPLGRSWLG